MSHGPDFLPPPPVPEPEPEPGATPPWAAPSQPSPAPRRAWEPGVAADPPAAAPDPPPTAPEEKVIERPHPLTGVARGGIALVAGVYFVAQELAEGGPGFSTSLLVLGLILLAVAAVAGISGVFTWRTTTFVADDDEFRIERKFVSQSSSRVDYTKVQSVDVSQPLIARIIGLAKVHIDVGGAGGLDLSFLSKARAESLREHLIERMHRAKAPIPQPAADAPDPFGPAPLPAPEAAPEEVIVEVPASNLLLGAFIALGTIGALVGAGLLAAMSIIAQTPVTMLAAAIGIGGWIWRQTGRNWNFRMTRRDGVLHLRRGALSTTAQGLHPDRIQGVAIRQDLLQRATGLWQMSVTVLGYGDPTGDEHRNTNAIVLPYGTWEDVLRVVNAIWPEVDLAQVQPHGQPDRARWLTPFTFNTHTWGIGEHVVVTQHGLLERVLTVVPHRRMQSASVHQGPIQRRLRLASVHVHTTDGPVNQRLYHLDETVARQVFREQVARARAARAVANS